MNVTSLTPSLSPALSRERINKLLLFLLLFVPTRRNKAVSTFVISSLVTFRWHTPGTNRVTTTFGTTFTTTVRVIDRFMAVPRTVGRIPRRLFAPALPKERRLFSGLLTSPTTARQSAALCGFPRSADAPSHKHLHGQQFAHRTRASG